MKTWKKVVGFEKNKKKSFRIVAIDYGIKKNILRYFSNHNCEIIIVPCKKSSGEILKLKPHGVFLSNGPGDPAATGKYSVKIIQELIEKNIPIFAGLGGGTSNAVFLTKYLTQNKIKREIIDILEKKIGSDFRLFFHKQGFMKSLNKMKNFKKKYKLHFVLVYPNIRCSTKLIYSQVNRYSSKINFNFGCNKTKKRFSCKI